jgi:hypothetical protein
VNVLIFSSHIRWISHYETELELIQEHIDKGDHVTHLYCSQALLPCDQNITNDNEICRDCIERRIFGQSLIKGNFAKIQLPSLRKESQYTRSKFKDIIELRNFKKDDFDLGLAVSSSLTTLFRDPEIDLNKNATLIRNFVENADSLYQYFQRILTKLKPDLVYIFNGRFAYDRALLRACTKFNIKAYVHERGSSIHKYMLYANTLPHDIAYITTLINNYWDNNIITYDKYEVGKQFYNERINGIEQSWYSFIINQKNEELPGNWDTSKRNIVIFNSSEDEFSAIGPEWKLAFYKSQLEGIKDIISIIKESNSNAYRLYLRMHPNLRNVSNGSVTELLDLPEQAIFVIPPESQVSTYTLISQSEKVISFGSTVGIEATFLHKPSILLGSSMYMNLNATYNPATREEFLSLLFQDLKPKELNNALKYGHYMKSFGFEFKYFKAESVATGGTFKGKYLYYPEVNSIIIKGLKKLRNKNLISEKIYYKALFYLLKRM